MAKQLAFLVKGVRFFDPTTMADDMRITIYGAAIRAYNRDLSSRGKPPISDAETITRFMTPIIERPILHSINGIEC